MAQEATPPALSPPVTPACISSPYGERPAGGPRASRVHSGVDLPAPLGAWIGAAAPGRVTAIRRINYSGLEVQVTHAGGLVTRYAHLGDVSPALVEGRRDVRAGDRLGRVGRTGITYGTHVHFEVWLRGTRVDPAPYLPGVTPCGGPGR